MFVSYSVYQVSLLISGIVQVQRYRLRTCSAIIIRQKHNWRTKMSQWKLDAIGSAAA